MEKARLGGLYLLATVFKPVRASFFLTIALHASKKSAENFIPVMQSTISELAIVLKN